GLRSARAGVGRRGTGTGRRPGPARTGTGRLPGGGPADRGRLRPAPGRGRGGGASTLAAGPAAAPAIAEAVAGAPRQQGGPGGAGRGGRGGGASLDFLGPGRPRSTAGRAPDRRARICPTRINGPAAGAAAPRTATGGANHGASTATAGRP